MSGLMHRARGFFSLRIRKDLNFRRVQETVPALRWLRPRKNERILDIGCGEGTYDYRIALRGARVFGFDLNRGQLHRAAASHKTPLTGFFCADAGAFPLRSGQFDTVMSLCVFEHLPDDRQTLREMWRVLRPGGRILLTLDSLSLERIGETWRDAHRERHSVRQFYTHSTVESLLEASGFKLERYRYLLRSGPDLALIRLSYATEHMPGLPAALTRLGLVSAGRLVSAAFNLLTKNHRGWTLLIEASRTTPRPANPPS